MRKTSPNRGILVVLYILAFVLLREWLLPVMELSNTGHLSLFLFFIILTFIISLARLNWWISGPLKIIYVSWVIHYIYSGKSLFSKATFKDLLNDMLSNFSIVLNGDWENLTDPFRTLLFFVLLWMTTYLVRYWIESRKNIFLFYVMTVVYVAFIDTFSAYSADGVIIRVMLAGLLLIGLLTITKLVEKHNVKVSTGMLATIAIPLLFAIAVSGLFSTLLPKLDSKWPDPLEYINSSLQGTGDGGSGTGMSKSGYGPDDSALGGPFMMDDTLVFEAEVDQRQYWKIETKNTYTSKGWEQYPISGTHETYFPGMELGNPKQNEGEEGEELKLAKLTMAEKFPFLIYPYGISKVFADADVSILYSFASDQYRTKINNSEGSLDSYELQFMETDFSLKELRDTKMEDFQTVDEDLSEYLQLPEELPERVKELARNITEEYESVYDKTKAIERYFGRSGFTYDQKNVATPGEMDDYVDQFLFDTKRGYCDNFSTSMVVMLRTIGIPAKWVKGFAPGEIARNAEDNRVYQVTNNEAHSWVEGYMPGIGWMPFEPTIGFGGPASIDYDIEMEMNDPEIPEMREREKTEEKAPEKTVTEEKESKILKQLDAVGSWLMDNIRMLIVILAIVLFVGWRLFVGRRKWLPKVLVPVYRIGKQDWDTYSKRYKSLLNQLNRFGITRKKGTTLSLYAVQVDSYFGGDTMRRLTNAYEKGLYGDDTSNHDWLELKEMWEDLIKRTSG